MSQRILTTATIIQVTSYYPPHLGGMEVVVQQQVESLVRASHDVRLLTTLHDSSASQRQGAKRHLTFSNRAAEHFSWQRAQRVPILN
jgi:hypothetical protein